MAVRSCIVCGATFETKSRRILCGSTECRKARRRATDAGSDKPFLPAPQATCYVCGKPFTVNRSQRLCSPECVRQSRRTGDARRWAEKTPEQRRAVYERHEAYRAARPEWAAEMRRRKNESRRAALAGDIELRDRIRREAREWYAANRERILRDRRCRQAATIALMSAEELEFLRWRQRRYSQRHKEKLAADPKRLEAFHRRQRLARRESNRRRIEASLHDAARLLAERAEHPQPAKPCVICTKPIVGRHITAVTCGAKECLRQYRRDVVRKHRERRGNGRHRKTDR